MLYQNDIVNWENPKGEWDVLGYIQADWPRHSQYAVNERAGQPKFTARPFKDGETIFF